MPTEDVNMAQAEEKLVIPDRILELEKQVKDLRDQYAKELKKLKVPALEDMRSFIAEEIKKGVSALPVFQKRDATVASGSTVTYREHSGKPAPATVHSVDENGIARLWVHGEQRQYQVTARRGDKSEEWSV